MDINKVIIVGRVTKEPEIKKGDNWTLAKFSVATNKFYKDKDGEKQSVPEFHNVVAWNKLAEVVENYIEKGMPVFVEGRVETDQYTDQQGNEKKSTKIIAQVIQK